MGEREELLPCPFCGSRDLSWCGPSTYVTCNSCGVEGAWNDDEDYEKAAKAWNTRAHAQSPLPSPVAWFCFVDSPPGDDEPIRIRAWTTSKARAVSIGATIGREFQPLYDHPPLRAPEAADADACGPANCTFPDCRCPGMPGDPRLPEAADAGAVAWRMRLIADTHEPGDWSYYNHKPSQHRRYECQPLYASPSDAGMRERAASLVQGDVVHHNCRQWPAWGTGNRAEWDEITKFADAMAKAIRMLPLSPTSTDGKGGA